MKSQGEIIASIFDRAREIQPPQIPHPKPRPAEHFAPLTPAQGAALASEEPIEVVE